MGPVSGAAAIRSRTVAVGTAVGDIVAAGTVVGGIAAADIAVAGRTAFVGSVAAVEVVAADSL
jgi:hypothetical protein